MSPLCTNSGRQHCHTTATQINSPLRTSSAALFLRPGFCRCQYWRLCFSSSPLWCASTLPQLRAALQQLRINLPQLQFSHASFSSSPLCCLCSPFRPSSRALCLVHSRHPAKDHALTRSPRTLLGSHFDMKQLPTMSTCIYYHLSSYSILYYPILSFLSTYYYYTLSYIIKYYHIS